MDAVNLLNHPGPPKRISGTSGVLSTFGAAHGGREVEFSLRLRGSPVERSGNARAPTACDPGRWVHRRAVSGWADKTGRRHSQ